MSSFGGLILTRRGRNLQAKAQAGAQLRFNRIAIGDGTLTGQQIFDLTALISEKKSLAITKLKTETGGKARVGCVLSNQDIQTGFYFREIGVFAQDPDLGEILYCYGNAGQGAEYIPAGGGPDIVEKSIDIITLVGNATNVSAVIDSSMVYETPEGAQEKANQAELNAKLYTDQLIGQVEEDILIVEQQLESHLADDVRHTTQAEKDKLAGIESGAEVNTVVPTGTYSGLRAQATTKVDVGLGSVENYGIATQAEAEAGTSTAKYMTPQRTLQSINKKITVSASTPSSPRTNDIWIKP